MRNIFVTKIGNEKYLNEWEFETPKDVRAGAVKELTVNLMTNLKKVNKTSIRKFQMKYKSKKKKTDALTIPKSALDICFRKKSITMYKSFLGKENCTFRIGKRQIKKMKNFKIESDSKLFYDGKDFFFLIPYKKQICSEEKKNSCIRSRN